MSELATNTPRLMAAAKEFNIGKDTLIEFLESKGFKNEDLKPTAKLTEDMYRVLQLEFQQDKVNRQNAEKIELAKGPSATEPKKKKDEETLLTFKKKEAVPVPVPEKQPEPVPTEPLPVQPEVVVEKPVEVEKEIAVNAVETEEKKTGITKIEAPELEAPKVISKIDLDAIDSSTRPKKSTKKPEEKVTEPVKQQEPVKQEVITPSAPPPQAPVVAKETPAVEEQKVDAPATIENIKADRLEGPKILGKIQLPVDNDTRPKKDHDDKRKRKRIPVERKPGSNPPPSGPGAGAPPQGRGPGGQHSSRPRRWTLWRQ